MNLKKLTDNMIVVIPIITAVLFTLASWLATRVDVPAWTTTTATAIALLIGQTVVPMRFSKPIQQMKAKKMPNLANKLSQLKSIYHGTEFLQIAILIVVLYLSWFTDTSTNILVAVNFLGVAFIMVIVGIIAFNGDGMVATFEEALLEVSGEEKQRKSSIAEYRTELKSSGMSDYDIEHMLYFRYGAEYRSSPPSGHRNWLTKFNKETEKKEVSEVPVNSMFLVNGINLLSLPVGEREPYFANAVAEYGDTIPVSEYASYFGITPRTFHRWKSKINPVEEKEERKLGF
jgi:hypothetical protein